MAQKVKRKMSEYEELRLKNIEDNKAVLAKLMTEVSEVIGSPIRSPPRKRAHVKHNFVASEPRRSNPTRSCRPVSKQVIASRRASLRTSATTAESSSVKPLVVKLGSFRKLRDKNNNDTECETDILQVFDDDDDDDDDDRSEKDESDSEKWSSLSLARKRRGFVRQSMSSRRVSNPEVTEADLKRVATSVCEKRYDSDYGSTCHQCRQKTDDMKTICRSGECLGIRGQFCGPCLRNRYGEDAKKALMNPEWVCPPCRGICNCSFCRRHSGKSSTGILIHLARQYGYSDVNSYLQSLKRN